MTMGGLAACTMLTSRALQAGLRAMGVWTQFQSVRLGINKVHELFSMPSETSGSFRSEEAIGGQIQIKQLSFQYCTQEKAAT